VNYNCVSEAKCETVNCWVTKLCSNTLAGFNVIWGIDNWKDESRDVSTINNCAIKLNTGSTISIKSDGSCTIDKLHYSSINIGSGEGKVDDIGTITFTFVLGAGGSTVQFRPFFYV
jgi:hypothetical protein